ncbi:MAG TPA: FAD-dependent oxidoreductase [Pseudonocardiaceae bacterium]|jgi:glycine/D-amino acid oxidase-like deaminating enzyme
MSRSGYDVVVVGAGVVGASAAAALAASGMSVAVVTGGDRVRVSATAASGGLVRCYESDPYLRSLALRSHELLWGRPGQRRELAGHRITGSLVCLTAEEAEKADAVLDELHDRGVRARLLCQREIARRWPALGTERIVAGLWEPTGAYADPPRTAAMFLTQARRRGAVIFDGGAVALLLDGDTVYGVATEGVDLTARTVVLAAGSGTPALLPPTVRPRLRTRRVRYALVGWPPGTVPTIMDHVTGMWGRPYGADSLLVGRPVDEWDVRPAAGREITPAQFGYIRDGGVVRWPGLATAPLRGARWGTDLYSPAGPHLGPVDNAPGLVLATAWSGAGFKTAPAAGEAVVHAVHAVLEALER